jgi:hexosaminidase
LSNRIDFELSNDGKKFEPVGTVDKAAATKDYGWYNLELKSPRIARYIRLKTPGGTEWAFFDEIMVNGKLPGPNFLHAAVGKPVTTTEEPSKDYNKVGIGGLTDGHTTHSTPFQQIPWLGWEGKDLDATIDMGSVTELHTVGGHFLQYIWAGIQIPQKFTVSVSDDGKTFKEVGDFTPVQDREAQKIQTLSVKLDGVNARYVKILVKTSGQWLFCDELFVNPKE